MQKIGVNKHSGQSQDTLVSEWRGFLKERGIRIGLSNHARKRLSKRFPKYDKLKDGEIILLVKQSKPLLISIRTSGPAYIVKNKDMVFVVCIKKATIITIYPASQFGKKRRDQDKKRCREKSKKTSKKGKGGKREHFNWRQMLAAMEMER